MSTHTQPAAPSRLAIVLRVSEAEHLYQLIRTRYDAGLSGAQVARLFQIHWKRGAFVGLNTLLGQLAARSIQIDPELRRHAEAVVIEWAETSRQRRVS